MRAHILSLILACAIWAAPGHAETAADGKDPIVVEGRAKELRYILKDVLAVSGEEQQIGRFERKLCPKVVGFPADYSAIIERLVRNNAAEAGLKLQKEDCKPNALVIFIDEPQRLVSELAKAEPEFFGHMGDADRAALSAVYQPIYSWRVTDVRSSRGVELQTLQAINGEASNARIVRNAEATRMHENTRQDILLSFAVVDIAKTEGKSMRQLADLATMHLMMDIKADAEKASAPESILTLMADGHAPDALPPRMSVMDKAMLRGLYQFGDNAQKASVQRGRIAKEIAKQEGQAAAAPKP